MNTFDQASKENANIAATERGRLGNPPEDSGIPASERVITPDEWFEDMGDFLLPGGKEFDKETCNKLRDVCADGLYRLEWVEDGATYRSQTQVDSLRAMTHGHAAEIGMFFLRELQRNGVTAKRLGRG